MTFISYAQNFEDVMLWRALKDIPNGFYIDVGAWSPHADSVTKAFYDRGWSGIDIEPNPIFQDEYAIKRPRDLFLNVGVSDVDGREIINIPNDFSGLSTFISYESKNHQKVEVEVMTLKSIFEKFVKDKDVHFLKIDVEGFEDKVIKGNDWSIYRPWVVVVESTLPNSSIDNSQKWSKILERANYSLHYRDGLNHFYVANERRELSYSFVFPPNVFDQFITSELQVAQKNALERLESIQTLTKLLAEVSVDSDARLDKINTLTSWLKESQAESTARLDQIHLLNKIIKDLKTNNSK